MISLLFIYFLGNYFYELADNYERSAWGHAILGIAFYYASTFVVGIMMVVLIGIYIPSSLDGLTDFQLGMMALPFGLLFTYFLYRLLKRRLSQKSKGFFQANSDLLDDEYLQ